MLSDSCDTVLAEQEERSNEQEIGDSSSAIYSFQFNLCRKWTVSERRRKKCSRTRSFPTLTQLLVHHLYLLFHPRSSDDVIERLLSQ